MSFEMHCMST